MVKWHPVHLNRNDRIRNFLNKRWDNIVHLSNTMLDNHWAGTEKFYFTGNGDPKCAETLFCLDADAHDWGTVEACVEFLTKINKRFRLHGYIEPSPRGAHLYFVLYKLGCNALYLKKLLGEFQLVLRDQLKKAKADVQGIEVKGTIAIITWNDRRQVTNVVAGVPCTIPQYKDAFDQWRLTNNRVKAERLRDRIDSVLPKSEPETVQETRKVRLVGSVTGCAIGKDDLDQLNGHYWDVAKALLQEHNLKANRHVVTIEDMAIFLMLLKFFTNHMNEDGTLPWDRWGDRKLEDGTVRIGMWTSLKLAGDIKRPFHAGRFAAIRNYLSSLGLLAWEDNTYRIGTNLAPGRAMKWKASEKLMQMLETEDQNSKQENGGASFANTKAAFLIKSLIQLLESDTIRPVQVLPTPIRWLSPDEIAPYITSFEQQLAA